MRKRPDVKNFTPHPTCPAISTCDLFKRCAGSHFIGWQAHQVKQGNSEPRNVEAVIDCVRCGHEDVGREIERVRTEFL